MKISCKFFILPVSIIAISLINCATVKIKDRGFSYEDIYKRNYIDGNGGIIMLTLEKGETYSASISPDQKYLVYSGNKNGNFDIFLRPLNDIISIPLLKSAPNQTEPMISPDGKNIAFVDDELDPEGDIAIIPLAPESILKKLYRSGQASIDAFYANKKTYLTNNPSNPERARDRNPAWSPDGNFIAFSSNREPGLDSDGLEKFLGRDFRTVDNIWIIPLKNPHNGRQLTNQGGMMPSFSPDGKKLAYVKTIEDKKTSNIFEIDLVTNREYPLTHGSYIDFYPSYTSKGELVFTRISVDTNLDGLLDMKDNGQIMILTNHDRRLSQNAEPIIISKQNENIFDTRASTFLEGSIFFAIKDKDNINVGVIPESGIFPLKKSPLAQLDYARKFYKSEIETYRLALEQIELSHKSDPLQQLAIELKDFEMLAFLKSNEKKTMLASIDQKMKEDHPFEKILLDIYYLSGNEPAPYDYAYEFNNNNLESYLEDINNNPGKFLEKIESKAKHPSPQYAQSTHGYVLQLYADHLFKKGKISLSRKIQQKILTSLPLYFNNPDILFNLGKTSIDTEIPPEYLFALYPEKHPYNISIEPLLPENEKNKTNYEPGLLKSLSDPLFLQKIEVEIFYFFKNAWQQNKEKFMQDILEKYPRSNYALLHHISSYSQAFVLFSQKRYKESFKILTVLDPESMVRSYWKFQIKILLAKNLEKLGFRDKAYQSFAESLLIYDRNYEFIEENEITLKVFQYYMRLADFHRKNRKIVDAWNAYFPLIQIMQQLEPQGVAREVIRPFSLRIFIDFDEMILEEAIENKDLVLKTLDYYSANNARARKYSLNSFIFGKAYLNTMYAIKLHQHYEATYTLDEKNKEKILEYFSEAEQDFQWSIYSDPSFFDAYITLGWMYQFIDEKRDSLIFVSPTSTEAQSDKILFDHLYEKYFPDYLFEENIQLYQKSLAYLSGTLPKQIVQSFYLNLANNYFLLTNYPKANENYSKIRTSGEERYKFENSGQEAQFYFHSGKAGYYTGNSGEAAKNLEYALGFYKFNSSLNKEEQRILLQQRSIIQKYLGLVYSDSGKFLKAIDTYKNIIRDTERTDSETKLDSVYLEIAYNILQYSKKNNDFQRVSEAIDYTKLAETSLNDSQEQLPPKFSAKIKIFGKSIPIYKVNYDSVFRKGENHLAFELPTINKFQYLYSIQADLHILNGNIGGATSALEKLIQKAIQDNSKHGRETLVSALMRLGELKYKLDIFTESRSAYVMAQKLSYESGNMKSYYLAEKNLMTLACREIENSRNSSEKINLANKFILEIEDFRKSYISLKINEAEQELKEKNKNMTLTLLDKSRLETRAIRDIQQIMLYRGIFEAYNSIFQEYPEINNQKLDFNKYYDKKSDQYKHIQEALYHLEGNYQITGNHFSFLNRRKERRLAMILDMNKALVEKSAGRIENAILLFKEIFDKAYQFNANELYLIAGYEYFQLIKNNRHDESLKILKKLDSIFKNNTYLIRKFNEIYQHISQHLIKENLNNRQYEYAMLLENYNRNLTIKPVIDSYLKDSENELSQMIGEYQEIEKIEEILAGDIEDLKLRRLSTEALEEILKRLVDRKASIKTIIRNNPAYSGYAFIDFPDILTLNDLADIRISYLYIMKIENETHAIYKNKNESEFKHAKFNISGAERQSLTSLSESELESVLSGKTESEELKHFILWIKNLSLDIIFADQDYLFFPFSKIMGRQIPRDYLFQSSILFEKNRNITVSSWIQNGKYKIPANDLNIANQYTFFEVSKPGDVKKYSYDVVDFEISGEKLNELDVLLKSIINNRNNISLSLLAYKSADQEKTSLYIGALNALFSAAGATIVTHTLFPRKETEAIYSQVLEGKELQSDILVFSGNTEISGAFFNQSITGNLENLARIQYDEFLNCNQQTVNFMTVKNWATAMSNTRRCKNIYQNYHIKNPEKLGLIGKNSGNYIRPNFDQFQYEIEILLNISEPASLESIQTIFKNVESVSTFDSDKEKSDFDKFAKKYIALLFSYGHSNLAISEVTRLDHYIKYNAEEAEEIRELYYYGQIHSGNLKAVSQELPSALLSYFSSRSVILEIAPKGYTEKIRWLMDKSVRKKKWVNNLILSGEYSLLEASDIQNLPPDYLWQKLDYFIYAKNSNAIADILTIGSSDPALKNLQTLINSLASNDFKKVLDSIEYAIKVIGINAQDDFYSKLVHIHYIVNFINIINTPESDLLKIMEKLGSINLQYNGKNEQMKIFTQTYNSLDNLINNPSQQSSSDNQLYSGLNKDLILFIKMYSLLLHPVKMMEHQDFYPEVSSFELNERMENINRMTKSTEILNTMNYEDMSYLLEFLIDSDKKEQALYYYFSYDRNQQSLQFQFPVTVSGIFKTFFDRYYFWTWRKNGIDIVKIKPDQINATILKNNKNIFYLPLKDNFIRNTILKRENGATFFTQTASGNLMSAESPSGINSCSADESLQEYAGYSIMKMYCQNPEIESENISWIGFSKTSEKRSLVQFYPEPVSPDALNDLASLTGSAGNYSIIFIDNAVLNIYLTFMKEFIFEYNAKPDQPHIIFDRVYNKLENVYGKSSDIKQILILQN